MPYCEHLLRSITSTSLEHGDTWLRIKALYLREGDQHWLEQLPTFKELQILSLKGLASGSPTINQSAIENIVKCRNLRSINLVFSKLDEVEMLLDIARGCLLLQKFSVQLPGIRVKPELANSLLLNLFCALPCLEFLALGLKFQMDGAILQDLARHCPRLTVLALPKT